jgi:hypothetical protein
MQGRFVEQQSVRQLAVLSERFAMIANNRDDGVAAIDGREQTRDLSVDISHFAVVRRRIRRRRRVRRMRIVKVHPRKERPRIVLPQPRQRAVDDLAAAPLRVERSAAVGHVADDLVVVALEAAIESETMIEDEGADERAGAVAAAKRRRQRLAGRRKCTDAVVAQPVMQRQEAGH